MEVNFSFKKYENVEILMKKRNVTQNFKFSISFECNFEEFAGGEGFPNHLRSNKG